MTANAHAKDGKADFGAIYDQPDPRDFYATLRPLDYAIPAHAQPVFDALVRLRRRVTGRDAITMADLCTSYGVNPALANHEVTLEDVFAHYAALDDADHETLVEADRAWYRERRRPDAVRTVGLDLATPALRYAQDVGLLDVTVAQDLESEEPSAATRAALADAGLVTVTGGIGYVTDHTIGRVLDCAQEDGGTPWFAAFALRWVSMDAIGVACASHGLELRRPTEQSFRQRRFLDDEERDYVLSELARLGIDAAGREAEGWYHANLWVALPPDVATPPGLVAQR